jgi:hypothetical protein
MRAHALPFGGSLRSKIENSYNSPYPSMDTKTKINLYDNCVGIFIILSGVFLVSGIVFTTVGLVQSGEENRIYQKQKTAENSCIDVFNSTFCQEIFTRLKEDHSELRIFATCLHVCHTENYCAGLCDRIFKEYNPTGSDRPLFERTDIRVGLLCMLLSMVCAFLAPFCSEKVSVLYKLLAEEEKAQQFDLNCKAEKNV